MGKKTKSAKRKARETDALAADGISPDITLDKGPQVPMDAIHVEDDFNEPTMGEKLATLNLAENYEAKSKVASTQTKPPSADSVHILLKQALRADDRALLIDCLFRQDEKVVSNSVSLLNPSDVIKFLQSLISVIQLRGAVLACALTWLRTLLLWHASIIMSQESSLAALNTLYQLIDSRVSTFNHALQLSSYLDVLYVEAVDDEEVETGTVPVIYEDFDESEDEGSEVSMETESNQDGGQEPQVFTDMSDYEGGDISD